MCDRPIGCKNCEKRDVNWGGYDIGLQWVTHPLEETQFSSIVQGRMSMKLGKCNPFLN